MDVSIFGSPLFCKGEVIEAASRRYLVRSITTVTISLSFALFAAFTTSGQNFALKKHASTCRLHAEGFLSVACFLERRCLSRKVTNTSKSQKVYFSSPFGFSFRSSYFVWENRRRQPIHSDTSDKKKDEAKGKKNKKHLY